MNYIKRNNRLVYLCLSGMIAGTLFNVSVIQSIWSARSDFFTVPQCFPRFSLAPNFMTNTRSAILARVIITGLLLCALVYQVKMYG